MMHEPKPISAWSGVFINRLVWFFPSPALQGWVRNTKRFLARFSGLLRVGFGGPQPVAETQEEGR